MRNGVLRTLALALLLTGCGRTDLMMPDDVPSADIALDGDVRPDVPAIPCRTNTDCEDRRVCNGTETCVAGRCRPGVPVVCDDGVACTRDQCDEAVNGCVATPDDLLCDNGVFCDGAEICNPMIRSCVPSPPIRCEDGDPCTANACDEMTRSCTSVPTDNDGDGFRPTSCGGNDCNDMDGSVNPAAREICRDGRDNNCDGRSDCADAACAATPECRCDIPVRESDPMTCHDGFDNDCDGRVDCADTDCRAFCMCVPTGRENAPGACIDGRDNDCNGLTDCVDPVCSSTRECCRPSGPERGPMACRDGVDNDCNGLTDCADVGCAMLPECRCGVPSPENAPGACLDMRDNDCDGAVDCADSDCAGSRDCVIGNDTCATAALISVPGNASGNTSFSNNDYTPPCSPGSTAPEVVYVFRNPVRQTIILDTIGSTFDTVLFVRRDSCEMGASVGCDDDAGGMLASRVTLTDAAPGVYFVFVDGFGGASGAYQLHISVGAGREVCDNFVDDDGDGLVDCSDADCIGDPRCGCVPEPGVVREAPGFRCFDGRDNDCDGRLDCADPDCVTVPGCDVSSPENNNAACSDGRDNDLDALTDCADPDCAGLPACPPPRFENNDVLCSDGRDNDFDGLIDCRDPDCRFTRVCGPPRFENTDMLCADRADNDGDGLVDCSDPDCAPTRPCACVFTPEADDASCRDGIDNDCDLAIDCADPGCAMTTPCRMPPPNDTCRSPIRVAVPSVTTGTTVGATNDVVPTPDGMGCAGGSGPDVVYTFVVPSATPLTIDLTSLSGHDPVLYVRSNNCDMGTQVACNDDSMGLNSRVGMVALPGTVYFVIADGFSPGSSGPFRLTITIGLPAEICTNGRDDDLDGRIDCADSDCAGTPFCCMSSGPENNDTTCSDGRDNDCNGQIDCADFACAATRVCCRPTGAENTDAACSDGRDNDCDGAIDCASRGCAATRVCCIPSPENCTDGRDNDCDGLVDCADPACAMHPACGCRMTGPENTPASCTDGLDNDCDGVSDCADPSCRPFPSTTAECCNGSDDNMNTAIDEFACGCASNADCATIGAAGRFPSRICYRTTLGVCGPACNTIGGDAFCNSVLGGTRCDTASGECR